MLPDHRSEHYSLISDEIDVASSIPRDHVSLLLNRGFKVFNLTTYQYYLMFFSVRRHPTNILGFRKAIACSLNLDKAIRLAMEGSALGDIIPHGFPGFAEGFCYQCGLNEALQYLDESGVQIPGG